MEGIRCLLIRQVVGRCWSENPPGGCAKFLHISVNLRITLLLEGFLTSTIMFMFLANIGTAYLINCTLELQTHNPGNLLILQILVQTKGIPLN